MYLACRVGLDREGSEYLGDQAVWISLVVLREGGHDPQQQGHLALWDSLADELVVVAEEEETATFAGALPSFEGLIAIGLRTETLLHDLVILEVLAERRHEELSKMESHLDIGLQTCLTIAFLYLLLHCCQWIFLIRRLDINLLILIK